MQCIESSNLQYTERCDRIRRMQDIRYILYAVYITRLSDGDTVFRQLQCLRYVLGKPRCERAATYKHDRLRSFGIQLYDLVGYCCC